jgi:hypothetical protein
MKRMIGTVMTPGLLMAAGAAQAELVRKQSAHRVGETVHRFEAVVKEKRLTVFARIDYAAGAKKVGMDLRPTELIIFGSPKVGHAADAGGADHVPRSAAQGASLAG